MDYFLFILSSVGITTIFTISSIFEPVRDFLEKRSAYVGEMINCPMCTGFWVGLVVSACSFDMNIVYAGAIASFSSWMMISLVELIQVKSQYILNSIDDVDEGESE